jgi:hypothetical protein
MLSIGVSLAHGRSPNGISEGAAVVAVTVV